MKTARYLWPAGLDKKFCRTLFDIYRRVKISDGRVFSGRVVPSDKYHSDDFSFCWPTYNNPGETNMNPSKQNTSPLTNAVVQLNVRSGSGNVLAILGHVHRAIQNSNRPELANSFLQEALAGHNDQLVPTCRRYVDVQ